MIRVRFKQNTGVKKRWNTEHLWRDAPLEVEGSWWPASIGRKNSEKSTYQRHGRLTYSPEEGAQLTLYHEGSSVGWGDHTIYGGGDSLLQQKITCFGVRYHTQEGHSTTYKVEYVFVGFFLPDVTKTSFLELSFGIKNLNNWSACTGFKFKRLKRNRGFQVSYRESKGAWARLDKFVSIRVTKWATMPVEVGNFGTVESQEHLRVQLKARKSAKLSLFQILEYLPKLEDFFTLAAGNLCNSHRSIIVGDFDYSPGIRGKMNPAYATLYSSRTRFDEQMFETQKYDFLFREEDLELPFNRHINRWIDRYAGLKIPFRLFSGAVFRKEALETRFLLLCQAVESLHRNFRSGTYIDPAKYESEVFLPLTGAIPPGLTKAFKESLKNKLKYGNEFSLRKRLKELIKDHEASLTKQISLPPSLAGDIADLRNYLTHLPNTEPPKNYGHIDFYTVVLRSIFILSVLTEIGFTRTHVQSLAAKCERFRWLEYKAPWDLKSLSKRSRQPNQVV